jgi:hypothetical protein
MSTELSTPQVKAMFARPRGLLEALIARAVQAGVAEVLDVSGAVP